MLTAGSVRYTQQYAVTITMHPKVRKYTAEEQYERFAHTVVIESLQKLFPSSKITLVCELTKSHDLHFHGIISFNLALLRANQNVPRWFRDKFRNHATVGFVLLKVIDNQEIWLDYILKTVTAFKEDLKLNPILIDEHGLASPLF